MNCPIEVTEDGIVTLDNIVDAKIHTNIMGSDHCPVELLIEI